MRGLGSVKRRSSMSLSRKACGRRQASADLRQFASLLRCFQGLCSSHEASTRKLPGFFQVCRGEHAFGRPWRAWSCHVGREWGGTFPLPCRSWHGLVLLEFSFL